jgi:hypothetical protein
MAAASDITTDTEDKGRIRWLLESCARGPANAIRVAGLARHLRIDERRLRDLVSELAEEDGTIGSSCDKRQPGYYLITNYDEALAAAAPLHSRARKLFRRARALEKAWPKLAQERFSFR